MDKVIIDDVDVSGCKHYKIGTCVADYLLTDMNFSEAKCKLCPNCYYKQLQRLKEENEQLKKQYNCYACDSCDGKEDYINMKRHTENAIKTVHKYRSTLQEIREIAKEQLQNVSDRCINTTPMYIVHKHIIDKINEVIGAE